METAPRRRPIDRVVATAVAAVASGGIVGALALAHAATPLIARRDPAAARDVITLMRASEHATYVDEVSFTRVDPDGRRVSAQEFAARAPGTLVTRSGSNLNIVLHGTATDCALVADRPSCMQKSAPSGLPESEVLRVAVDAGIYDVMRAPSAVIAGERARCFAIRAHVLNKQLPNDFGAESDLCFASDGVPLRNRRYSDRLDDWETTRVSRTFDATTLAPVLVGFDRTAPRVAG